MADKCGSCFTTYTTRSENPMSNPLVPVVSVAGRVLLCAIFFMAAVGNKIPNFNSIAEVMGKVGMPSPQLLLVGAIVFLIVGSVSVVTGYQAHSVRPCYSSSWPWPRIIFILFGNRPRPSNKPS